VRRASCLSLQDGWSDARSNGSIQRLDPMALDLPCRARNNDAVEAARNEHPVEV